MSEVDLLVFGCAVSFVAVAGAYVYVREAFTMRQAAVRREREEKQNVRRLRDVA